MKPLPDSAVQPKKRAGIGGSKRKFPIEPPPHDWVGNDGKGIYFDSIDNGAYILGKAPHSARTSWIHIDGEIFEGMRADIGGDPKEPGCISPGNISAPRRTPGLARRGSSVSLVRYTT